MNKSPALIGAIIEHGLDGLEAQFGETSCQVEPAAVAFYRELSALIIWTSVYCNYPTLVATPVVSILDQSSLFFVGILGNVDH